jgi:hypothetical protein
VRIDWAEKNIFMNYDEPARLVYDTEGATLRFKIYETWDSNQAIYLDDTITNTNRTGKGILDLWSTNPHGTPPTNAISIYTITVEVYNVNNQLLEMKKLKYMYSRKDLTRIYVKDENGNSLIAQINYLTIYDNDKYFRTYYGDNMTLPYPSYDNTKAYLEIYRIISSDKKYYTIARIDRIIPNAGTFNIIMKPSTDIIVYFDIEINNDIINKLFAIPGIGYIASFLMSRLLQLQNFGFAIAGYVLKLLGIKDYYVVRVEKISDTPLVFRFYYRSDPNPILIVLIVGIIGATIASWVMWNAIRDIAVARITYETQKVITERYRHYKELVDNVLDFCKTQPDPQKCFNDIVVTITPPDTGTDEAKDTQDDLMKTIETLKQFLYIAVVIAVILAVISYLRK